MNIEIPAFVRSSLRERVDDRALAHARIVSQRRGAVVWCVTTSVGCLAVKVSDDGHGARVVAREAAVLLRLGALDHGLYWAHGHADTQSWLATRWRAGSTTWDRWEAARACDSEVGRWSALASSRELANALTELHDAGWRHGDVQPQHAYHHDGLARLIDYSYAQGPGPISPHVPHRGGLFPLLAPEIAQSLLDAGDDEQTGVTITPAAEVYSLGGTLYGCWTSTYPVDLDEAADRQAMLTHIASGNRRDLTRDRPYQWSQVEDLLSAALDHHPENRPTAAEIAAQTLTG